MNPKEIRNRFLEFFKERGHKIVPSSSLVPENDSTTLFTGSGMQPMVPYLLGESHPLGKRIADSQKSFRSVDIEEVGDNRHTTFFEMLGNWSFGDYFKREQLSWIFEFLVSELKLDPERIYTTVFMGDESNSLPKDNESAEIWKDLFRKKGIEAKEVLIGSEDDGSKTGMQGGRIFYYDKNKNWWSRWGCPENMPGGEPGGPDSEIFYDFKTKHDEKFGKHCHPNCDCGRFLEIGNSVFMEYVRNADGSFGKLPRRNVDFGGGLERMGMALRGIPDVIEVNHRPILDYIENVSGKKYGNNAEETKSFRIIADHIKAAVFLIADGVYPSNTDRGYFVRRLIRRSVRYADSLGIMKSTLANLAKTVAEMYSDAYPELNLKTEEIKKEISEEEKRFRKTLTKGLKEFEKGADPFILFTTYGFPFELTQELAAEKGLSVDTAKFRKNLENHQRISRSGSEQKFKGGLGGHSYAEIKYHTATHLLHRALREVLGEHVRQKGSNITSERLRFDFIHSAKMTEKEIERVEKIVNKKIKEDLAVESITLLREEAEKTGALHFFGEKYGEKVNVYYIGGSIDSAWSKEFCGGPHVKRTSELGHFKILKEESSSAGVRRIKAVLE
ncbi:MAG: hypothetical protein A2427_04355 [Candidatus Nealsonbacteria bacterium RIFOXYC1_FULL_40_7]|uniref:alanine--tRNA ligase n=1 Tax=Candidatus Nealsonbacteria bacterium RIFOXYC1_FULL_40_7 TaxID=1801678 RepID=A0A1G2ELN3_9BACT|nr:MAG: hypothetical protein A2427_04355 [Candidatus Nealsonbacteria bacterium RIFOXYC1_FULL_40_7]